MWTDERIDDAVTRIEKSIDGMCGDMRDFRAEMREMRAEMHAGFVAVHRDITRIAMASGGAVAVLGAVVAALIAKG